MYCPKYTLFPENVLRRMSCPEGAFSHYFSRGWRGKVGMMHITYEVILNGSRFLVERQLCWRHLGELVYQIVDSRSTWRDGSPMFGAWIVWRGKLSGDCDACREEAEQALLHPMEAE